MARKHRLTVSIDGDVIARVDRLAKAERRSRSATMEALLKDGLDQTEATVHAFANPVLRDAFIKAFAQPEVVRQFAAVMGQEVSEDQLRLFQAGIEQLGGTMRPGIPAPVAPAASQAQRQGSPAVRKGGKRR